MFGQSVWKKEVVEAIQNLEQSISDLKKAEIELRVQNRSLTQAVKGLGRKLVLGFPISLESLDKGLSYDLIFSSEIGAWKETAPNSVILDLRPRREFEKAAIPGAVNIPNDQLAQNLGELSPQAPILLVCENGIKSVSASELLGSRGFHYLYVVKGGMSLYQGELEGSAEDFESEELLEVVDESPAASPFASA